MFRKVKEWLRASQTADKGNTGNNHFILGQFGKIFFYHFSGYILNSSKAGKILCLFTIVSF